jgi:hypothetical protein
VDVVLTGPRNVYELRENVAAAERGPLGADEMTFTRQFGRVVRRVAFPLRSTAARSCAILA